MCIVFQIPDSRSRMQVPDSFLDRLYKKQYTSVCEDKDWDKYKNIIFSWACGNTDETTIRFLLTKDVDPAFNKDWPLYNACQNGQTEIVKILLTYESVRKNASENRNRSIIAAECEEFTDIVELLLQIPNVAAAVAAVAAALT